MKNATFAVFGDEKDMKLTASFKILLIQWTFCFSKDLIFTPISDYKGGTKSAWIAHNFDWCQNFRFFVRHVCISYSNSKILFKTYRKVREKHSLYIFACNCFLERIGVFCFVFEFRGCLVFPKRSLITQRQHKVVETLLIHLFPNSFAFFWNKPRIILRYSVGQLAG